MNIALLGTLDAGPLLKQGPVVLERIRSTVAAHLDQTPALHRVLRRTRPGQGPTAWVDASDFCIDEHVVLGPPGNTFPDERAFLDWCAHETLVPLDKSKPLWRISVVPGLSDQRLGILVVVHHVVADGLRGIAMIAGLLDLEPAARRASPSRWQPAQTPTAADLVRDNLRARAAAVRSFRPEQLRHRLATVRGLRAELPARAPTTVLGGAIGPGRQVAVIREPLDALKAAAHAHGCTINDLLLAAVTDGLREMLGAREGRVPDGMVLRASIPVGDLDGREGGMMIVGLPVGLPEAVDRLQRIATETSRGKESPHGGVAGIVAMPATLARLGVLWAKMTAATHINLYVTNVPGPPVPLYLAGARLQQVVPLAPLVAGVRLSVTALSYDGTLSVALLADEAITDFATLADGVRSGFRSYVSEAPKGIHSSPELVSGQVGAVTEPPNGNQR